MSLIEQLVQSFAPHYCVGCDEAGDIFCADCLRSLPRAQERCYKCVQPTKNAQTCAPRKRTSALRRLVAATPYTGVAKDLVQALKFGRAQAAAERIADMLAERCKFEADLLVHVPTVPARVRMRGYDQAELIAKQFSKRVGIRRASLFVRIGHERQLGKNRHDRLLQAGNFFELPHPKLVAGKRIVLVDDVVTTGATLEAAALLCGQADAERVEAVVFAAA